MSLSDKGTVADLKSPQMVLLIPHWYSSKTEIVTMQSWVCNQWGILAPLDEFSPPVTSLQHGPNLCPQTVSHFDTSDQLCTRGSSPEYTRQCTFCFVFKALGSSGTGNSREDLERMLVNESLSWAKIIWMLLYYFTKHIIWVSCKVLGTVAMQSDSNTNNIQYI